MGRGPSALISKYINSILNDITHLQESVYTCNPKAVVYSERILKTSKKALERQIIDKEKYDDWIFKVENLNKEFANKCSCLTKNAQIK